MGKIFNPLEILKRIEKSLMNRLSERQLKLLLLLSAAAKNNGKGELELETIKNCANICFGGEDLFVVCQTLKKLGWGKLTCCKCNYIRIPPCLRKNWKNLLIGIEFSFERRMKNGKTQKTNRDRKNNRQYEM